MRLHIYRHKMIMRASNGRGLEAGGELPDVCELLDLGRRLGATALGVALGAIRVGFGRGHDSGGLNGGKVALPSKREGRRRVREGQAWLDG